MLLPSLKKYTIIFALYVTVHTRVIMYCVLFLCSLVYVQYICVSFESPPFVCVLKLLSGSSGVK